MGFDFGSFGQSAASNFINTAFQWIGAAKQHKRNKELMSLQNDYAIGQMDHSNEIWQQQNATQVQNQMDLTRQNPILQKIGMQQAGLNVNGQAGGNVASAPTGTNAPSGGSVGNPGASNPFSFMTDLFGKMNELKIQESQNKLLQEQAKNVAEDTSTKEIDNASRGDLNQSQIDLNRANQLLAEGKTNEAKAEVYRIYAMTDKDIEKIDAEIDAILNGSWYDKENIELGKGQLKVQQIMADIEKAKVDLANRQLKEQMRVNNSIIANNMANAGLSHALAQKAKAEASAAAAMTQKLYADAKVSEAQVRQLDAATNNLVLTGDAQKFQNEVQRIIGAETYANLTKQGLAYNVDIAMWNSYSAEIGAYQSKSNYSGPVVGRMNKPEANTPPQSLVPREIYIEDYKNIPKRIWRNGHLYRKGWKGTYKLVE